MADEFAWIPLFFVQVEETPPAIPGREKYWAGVWFDRETAQHWADREERKQVIAAIGEANERFVTVARVVSADELLDEGGPEALGRAVAENGMQMHLALRLLTSRPAADESGTSD